MRSLSMMFVVVLSLTLLATHARAQSGGPWSLTWSSMDAGGGTSAGGSWILTGTIGQPDAGASSASPWSLAGGYWSLAGAAPPACVSDVDDGSGTGTPDGGVTIDDLLYYLFIFETGLLDADVDDGSGTGTPDGGVTIDDLLYYLQRFEAGC